MSEATSESQPPSSKTLIPLETSANSGVSKPPQNRNHQAQNRNRQARKHWFRSRRLQILGFGSHLKSEPPSSKTLIPLGTSANSWVSKPPQIATTELENTDFARGVCKFWGFEATSVDQAQAEKRWFRSRPLHNPWFRIHLDRSGSSSKTVVSLEAFANSVASQPP